MNETQLKTVAQLRAFLNGTPDVQFQSVGDDTKRYEFIAAVLKRLCYPHLGRADKGVVLRYLERLTGEDIADEEWATIIETNFMSGVRLSHHYLPKMKAKSWGRIIFISSESAINIPVEMIHYGVTKTMQLALARGLGRRCTKSTSRYRF